MLTARCLCCGSEVHVVMFAEQLGGGFSSRPRRLQITQHSCGGPASAGPVCNDGTDWTVEGTADVFM